MSRCTDTYSAISGEGLLLVCLLSRCCVGCQEYSKPQHGIGESNHETARSLGKNPTLARVKSFMKISKITAENQHQGVSLTERLLRAPNHLLLHCQGGLNALQPSEVSLYEPLAGAQVVPKGLG